MEQNEKDADSDYEMSGAVVRVHELDKPSVWQEPLLNGFLVVQPNGTFESDDLHCVVEGMHWDVVATHANRPESVAGERIDEIERPHDEDFFPPPCAVLTNLVWHRGRGVIGHGVYTLGRTALGLTPSVGLAI